MHEAEEITIGKAFVGFTEEDEKVLVALRPFFEEIVDEMVDRFYEQVMHVPELAAIIRKHSSVERLKQAQKAYFLRLVQGGYGDEYARERYKIGSKHEQIKLDPRWYLGAYQIYYNLLIPRLVARHGRDPAMLEKTLLAVTKLMGLDAQMAVETYIVRREGALAEANHALQAANRELEEMAHIVSHDLKAPLVTLQGFAGRLEEACTGKLDEKERRYLSTLREVSKQAGQLVEGLLDLTRIQGGSFRVRAVDIGAVMQQVRDSLDAQIQSSRAVIEVEVDAGTPRVQADPIMLYDVLVNLVGNALKFAKPDHPPRIQVRAQTEDESVVLSVRDNGIGIPADKQAEVFQIFRKLNKDTPGIGIGLAAVKKLVEKAGGKVGIESKPRQGTIVFFSLPRT